jgi:hypothetical protein
VSDRHVHRAVTTQKPHPPGAGDIYNDGRFDPVFRITSEGLMIPHNVDCSKHRASVNLTALAASGEIVWMTKVVEPVIFERRGGSHHCLSEPHDVLGIRAAEYTDVIQFGRAASVGRTKRCEHVRASNCNSLAPGGKLL